MFTIHEIFNEDDDNINHHGFNRDVSNVKAFGETEKTPKIDLKHIAKFIGKFLSWKTKKTKLLVHREKPRNLDLGL